MNNFYIQFVNSIKAIYSIYCEIQQIGYQNIQLQYLYIILSLFLALVTRQTYSIVSKTQLVSEGDCIKSVSLVGCSWSTKKKACAISTTPVALTVTYTAYCDTCDEADFLQAISYTDYGNYSTCAYFIGCTPFAKHLILNVKQQVIDVSKMELIVQKLQLSYVKKVVRTLCYTFVDANTCELKATFAIDKECRDPISTGTTKPGGGCVESGNNCSDWNKLKLLHVIGKKQQIQIVFVIMLQPV